MAEGKTFDIPEAGFKWFKEKLEKLGKRAERLVGEKLFLTVVGFHREEDKTSRFYNQKIMEVFVAFPEPKLNGWEFVAQIDHANEVGNVIRSLGDEDLPEIYRTRGPECDHCEKNRRRRDSFIVYHAETGEYKQVGTSCLKDFLGHGDAEKWAKVAQMIAGVGELARTSYNTGHTGALQDLRWYNTEDFCAAAAQSILDRGWVSKKVAREGGRESTCSDAWNLYHNHAKITDEAKDLAERALEWARSLDGQNISDYEHNCYVIGNAEAIEARSAGIAASIVGVYQRKNRPVRPNTGVSDYYGIEGQRFERNVTLEIVSECEMSTRHVFKDEDGNVFVWFASGASLRQHKGNKIRIKGTIKRHNLFRGTKQNLVNRVKVIEVFDEQGLPQSYNECPIL